MSDQFAINSPAHVLRFLGPPRIEEPDGVVGGAITQRHRLALLALLALAPNRVLGRDRLLGLLWPETETSKARHLLNVAAHTIRKSLGEDALISEGDALRLELSSVWVDVLEFERMVRSGDAAAAVELYTGSFLEGLALPKAVEFEHWQQQESERLKQQYQSALEVLALRTAQERGALAALPWWRRRLACTPDDSRVVLQLMQVLALSGDRAGALRVALDHAELLKSEFGAAADPDVSTYAATLKHSTTSVVSIAPTTLQPALAPAEVPRRSRPRASRGGLLATVSGGVLALLSAIWAAVHFLPASTPALRGPIREIATRGVEPRAHEAWLRARSHLLRRTTSDLDACISEADLAISIDSAFASGYAVKGACLFVSTYLATLPPSEAFFGAEQSARRALALDPNHAGAHVVLAWVMAAHRWDWAGAEQRFRRAIELNPAFDYGLADYSYFLSWMGRHDQALAVASEAERLAPTVPVVTQGAAMALYLARRYDEAIARANYTISLDSAYFLGHQRLAFAYAGKGRYSEAVRVLKKAVSLAPGYVRQQGFLGYMYGRAGRKTQARSILTELLSMGRHSYVPPTAVAMVLLGLEDKEGALEWLERGYQGRDADMVLIKVWPPWDPLRSDMRFERLVRRMNLPL